jgi:hypothetical protein
LVLLDSSFASESGGDWESPPAFSFGLSGCFSSLYRSVREVFDLVGNVATSEAAAWASTASIRQRARFQLLNRFAKGEQLVHLGEAPAREREFGEFGSNCIAQQQIIDPPLLVEGVEIDLLQFFGCFFVELFEALEAGLRPWQVVKAGKPFWSASKRRMTSTIGAWPGAGVGLVVPPEARP